MYGLCPYFQGAASSPANDAVYDIYTLSTEAGGAGGESLAALGAPLVQVVGYPGRLARDSLIATSGLQIHHRPACCAGC